MKDELELLLQSDNIKNKYIEQELWTSRQRQGNSLHEISYRACFKPQLPNFFITRLTQPGDRVLDPFSGRGTTAIEAALLGRRIAANDINPLSEIFTRPRIEPPSFDEVQKRLNLIDLQLNTDISENDPDLSPFYHPETEKQIRALRYYLNRRQQEKTEDNIDRWIRMVATNRLTGHSPGFFSVYTLPPNQAITPQKQREINIKLGQIPPLKNIFDIILKKTKQLLSDIDNKKRQEMAILAKDAWFSTKRAQNLDHIPNESITLTVTSPPFLDIVHYAKDNWLRCWFNHIDVQAIAHQMSTNRSISVWEKEMTVVLQELFRVTKLNGYVAFEVGEIRNGKIKLDEVIVPLGEKVGFIAKLILINKQNFTKTSNIWGISNNNKGTNTNRIVIFTKK